PLNERLMDIPVLTAHIIDKMNHEYGRNVRSISKEATMELSKYSWPGNIRELENVVGRTMIYMENDEEEIKPKHLPKLHAHSALGETQFHKNQLENIPLQDAVESFEKEYSDSMLKQYNYNKTKAAKKLKISIRNLYYKMAKYNLKQSP